MPRISRGNGNNAPDFYRMLLKTAILQLEDHELCRFKKGLWLVAVKADLLHFKNYSSAIVS